MALRINSEAPKGESRRLLGVELTARNLKSFSRSDPSVIDLKQFPAYLNRWDSQQARNEGVFAH